MVEGVGGKTKTSEEQGRMGARPPRGGAVSRSQFIRRWERVNPVGSAVSDRDNQRFRKGSPSRESGLRSDSPCLASGLRSARLRHSLVSFLISSARLRLPSPSFSISHCASEHSCEKRLNRNAAFRAPLLEFAASAPIISRRPGAAGYNRAFRRRGRAMGQTAARCGRTTDKLTAPWRKRAGKAAEGSEYGRQNV